MKYFEFTHPTPEYNLAVDEALLDIVEDGVPEEVLRIWTPISYFIVVGYSNFISVEVEQKACISMGIPIFRRCSGGGAVLQGPGCLNYSLILQMGNRPEVATISDANCFIMNKIKNAFSTISGQTVGIQGITDLSIDGFKISGNAQRRKRNSILFHGCFLLNMDLSLISKVLKTPSKQPAYRANRSHEHFVQNCHLDGENLKLALRTEWNAWDSLQDIPDSRITQLVHEKYSQTAWNRKFV